MFDVGGVGGEDALDAAGAGEEGGVGGGAAEDGGGPVKEAVAVEDEGWEGSQ